MPSQEKHCVILGARPVENALRPVCAAADYLIAADAGYLTAQRFGLVPQLLVGDYDTAPAPAGAVCLPAEKDDTDLHYAAKCALLQGASSVTILGGTGGRLDHTLANVCTLLYLEQHGVRALLQDAATEVRVLLPGTHLFPQKPGWYFSLFAYDGSAQGVSLRGVKYPLSNAALTGEYPLGVSNEILAQKAEVVLQKGVLLCVFCKKEEP